MEKSSKEILTKIEVMIKVREHNLKARTEQQAKETMPLAKEYRKDLIAKDEAELGILNELNKWCLE